MPAFHPDGHVRGPALGLERLHGQMGARPRAVEELVEGERHGRSAAGDDVHGHDLGARELARALAELGQDAAHGLHLGSARAADREDHRAT